MLIWVVVIQVRNSQISHMSDANEPTAVSAHVWHVKNRFISSLVSSQSFLGMSRNAVWHSKYPWGALSSVIIYHVVIISHWKFKKICKISSLVLREITSFSTRSLLKLLSVLPVIALPSLFTITDRSYSTRFSSSYTEYWRRDNS